MTSHECQPEAGSPLRAGAFRLYRAFVSRISSLVVWFLTLAIRAYQLAFSPAQAFLFGPGGGCRFTPSCSEYAIRAIRGRGVFAGGWLALKRIGRCHPWGGHGHDPASEKEFGI